MKYDYYCDVLIGVNQILNKGVLLIIFLALSIATAPMEAQNSKSNSDPSVVNVNELESDGIREELQRYFGYEDLFFGYLTLPYDTSQNVNQIGRFVDSGFIYLALLPLLLLVLVYKRKIWFYFILISLVIYLFVCFSFSRIGKADGRFISVSDESWPDFVATGGKGLGGEFLVYMYDFGSTIVTPLVSIISSASGPKDHISYPILFMLFIGILYLISSSQFFKKNITKSLGIIAVSYFILWWLLSSGIVWYGFLMYPLLLTLIARGVKRSKLRLSFTVYEVFKKIALSVLLIWTCMAFVSRISYVNQASINPDSAGKSIENEVIMLYSAGLINAEECLEISEINVAKGVRAINADNRLVIRVGTHLEFDIRDNHLRVTEDNTMGLLFEYYKLFRDKEEFVGLLKALGYGYVIIDLNTPFLDRTPEQTLSTKFKLILGQLYNNPKVRLVTTDREVMLKESDGSKRKAYRVIGHEYLSRGSYAIYEIL